MDIKNETELSPVKMFGQIIALESETQRLKQDLKDTRAEMTNNFNKVNEKMEAVSGKLDAILLNQSRTAGQVQGGWSVAVKFGSTVVVAGTFLITIAKFFSMGQ